MNELYFEEIKKYVDLDNGFWKTIYGKTVMVAGASGLIGSCLVDMLLCRNRNHHSNIKIIALSRSRKNFWDHFSNYENRRDLVYYPMDICEKIELHENPDYIFHIASDGDPSSFSRYPVEVMKANFTGLDNILSFAHQKHCTRVLYVSSGEVYGQSVEGQIFDETFSGYVDHSSARSSYPAAKRAAEVLCQSYIQEYGLDAVIARPCHIFGPCMKKTDSRAVAQFMFSALSGENITMKSDGSQQRSMCYVFDCVTALLTILARGQKAEAYNIAVEEEAISIRQLAECICESSGVKLQIRMPDEEEKRGYNTVNKSILDCKKLYSLGWRPQVEIRQGIRRTLEIMKKDDKNDYVL